MDERAAEDLAHVVQPQHVVLVLERVVEQGRAWFETRHSSFMAGHVLDVGQVVEHHEQVHQDHGAEDDGDWAEEAVGHPVDESSQDGHPG